MKPRCLPLIAALAMSVAPLLALAQASAPPPAPAASAAAPIKMPPRLFSPEEKRDNAMPAGELRPERQVTPQISIPFGKKPPPAAPPSAPNRERALPANAIDAAAARCEAERGEQVRAKCRDRLAREARSRAPS